MTKVYFNVPNNRVVVVPGVAGKITTVYGLVAENNGFLNVQDGTTTLVPRLWYQGVVLPVQIDPSSTSLPVKALGWFATSPGNDLALDGSSGATASGYLWYTQV